MIPSGPLAWPVMPDEPWVLLYLHGHGSSPSEVAPTIAHLDPEGRFVAVTPEAPFPLGDGGGSWFEHGPRGVEPASLEAAVSWVMTLLGGLEADLGISRSRVVLGGFSQGAAMALTLATRSAAPFGGLLLQAPFVPESLDAEVDPAVVAPTEVLVQHGVSDEVVPDFLGRDLAETLGAAGSRVVFESLSCGHERAPAMLDGARRWLAATVGAAS